MAAVQSSRPLLECQDSAASLYLKDRWHQHSHYRQSDGPDSRQQTWSPCFDHLALSWGDTQSIPVKPDWLWKSCETFLQTHTTQYGPHFPPVSDALLLFFWDCWQKSDCPASWHFCLSAQHSGLFSPARRSVRLKSFLYLYSKIIHSHPPPAATENTPIVSQHKPNLEYLLRIHLQKQSD